MQKTRLIASLLIKDGLIVQCVGFNKYYPIGRPKFPIEFLVQWDVDEIIFIDIDATERKRIIQPHILEQLTKSCFLPLTIGGGISSMEDVRYLTKNGADKVSLNTHAINNPKFITEIANTYGSQCIVISIDYKIEKDGRAQVYSNSGQVPTGLNPYEWALKVESHGAGEILLTSIDRDGSKKGYDINTIKRISESVSIPVIANGGVGNFRHFADGIQKAKASAVCAANIFHHVEHSTIIAKACLKQSQVNVRLVSEANYSSRNFDKNGRLIMLDEEELNKVDLKPGKKEIL